VERSAQAPEATVDGRPRSGRTSARQAAEAFAPPMMSLLSTKRPASSYRSEDLHGHTTWCSVRLSSTRNRAMRLERRYSSNHKIS
jgi:hypothetical protein